MKTILQGFQGKLKVGYQYAAKFDSWRLDIPDSSGWAEWYVHANVSNTRDFWFENNEIFTVELTLKPRPLILRNASKLEFNGKTIILKGQGEPSNE